MFICLPDDEQGLHALQLVVVACKAVLVGEQVGSILPLVQLLHVLEEGRADGIALLGHQHDVRDPVVVLVVEALRDAMLVVQVKLVQRSLCHAREQ